MNLSKPPPHLLFNADNGDGKVLIGRSQPPPVDLFGPRPQHRHNAKVIGVEDDHDLVRRVFASFLRTFLRSSSRNFSALRKIRFMTGSSPKNPMTLSMLV